MWASAGQANFTNELAALASAISTYGSSLGSLVTGIAVGSEDLYRNSPTGIAAMEGVGANPDAITSFISQVRTAIANTPLSGAPVGHVDTWTAWVNGSNDAVIQASDFIGMDAYPYFQNTMPNSIDDGYALFFEALDNTTAAAEGKPVWITETGWPVSGPTENLAVASLANAQTYWDQVGCAVFGKYNTWWYTLQDAAPTTPSPSFGIVGSTLSTTPLFDLTCSANASLPSTSATSASSGASSVTSIASSVGASEIASADKGVTSIAGSGPIVISADSSISAMAAAASPTGSGVSTATAAAAAGAKPATAGTGIPVAPGSGGVNTTVSSGKASTATGPSGSAFTGGAAAVSGTVGGAVALLIAAVAAL